MLGFADSFLAWTAATLIPAFVGLLLVVSAGKYAKPKYLVAYAIGIFLWFFVDTIGGAASLDVIDAFSVGLAQIGTVALFVIGLVSIFAIDRNRNLFSPQSAIGKYGLTIPYLVAVSLGIHGLAEGGAAGAFALRTSSTSLIDAFSVAPGGNVNAVIAYVLHKGFEPMMIGSCYCAFAPDRAQNLVGRLKDLLFLTLAFGITSLIGFSSGYYIAYDVTYLYALGMGTSIYALVRLAGPLFDNPQSTTSKEPIKIAILIALGLLSLYVAALFHSG